MTRLVDSALALAKADFRVFPAYGITGNGKCQCGKPGCDAQGKHPAVKGWKDLATTDVGKVGEWWQKNPGRNPGIATGNGLVILDVDGETGMESLRKLEEEYGALPPTQCVLTSRGKHYYFHSDLHLPCSVSVLGDKLDIRADGGLVIGAGGHHESGHIYKWEPGHSPDDIPMAELPSWIPERLHRKGQDKKVEEKSEKPGFKLPDGMIPEGSRDTTLFKYGCYLRGSCGKDMDFIKEELIRINEEKCDPPLPLQQVLEKVHQVDQYPRAGGAEKDFKPALRLICAADVPDEEARFILNPYLPEGQLTLIQGNPGDGKTVFACWLAALVSTGRDLQGIPCVQGNVLLLSVEDEMPVLKRRFVASGGDVNHCFFVSDASGLTFLDPQIEQLIQEENIRMVLFDPLQAFLGAKVDMNRANETRPVLAELKEVAKRNNCATAIISHINKGNKDGLAIQRALGSMDIPAACRSVLHVGRLDSDHDKRLVVHVKSSNAREGRSIQFSIIDQGGVRFEQFTDKGYENLSELSKKTRKASENPIYLASIISACKDLLSKHPNGIQVPYNELGVNWPAGVKPGPLLDSLRYQLEDAGISITTGKRAGGRSTVLIMPYHFLGDDPTEPPQSA